jgi:flagellar assembly protein FliH
MGQPVQQSSWEIVEDPTLTRGGCEVETDDSRVDATVERRLAQVISNLFGGERGGD